KQPHLERPFRAIAYPVFPALALLLAFVFLAAYAVSSPLVFGLFAGLFALSALHFRLVTWPKLVRGSSASSAQASITGSPSSTPRSTHAPAHADGGIRSAVIPTQTGYAPRGLDHCSSYRGARPGPHSGHRRRQVGPAAARSRAHPRRPPGGHRRHRRAGAGG